MLKSLRIKLTLICVLITGILLGITAASIILISERQMDKQSEITFQNNINSIVYKLQSSRTIDTLWLSQVEAGNNLIVHIEDNGTPILYRGSWIPKTDRNTLVKTAKTLALNEYGFNTKVKPYSVIDVDRITYSLSGSGGDKYQAAAIKIPSDGASWQSVIVLRDISADHAQKLLTRLSFSGLILAALALLFGFSWWFAGRTIAPIEESHKNQVEFVAAASHELRSPLAVIQASISALKSADPEQSRRFMDASDRECIRMASLIDDLLFLASSDAGSRTFHREPIEPDTLLTELYESYSALARRSGKHLSVVLPEDEISTLSGDQKHLYQALSILLDNALSYTPDGGCICLAVCEDRRSVLFSVSDNGPGIPADQKLRIFDRFYRADPCRSKKEHYGLGLSVALEIAELHGGSIAVTDAPGGGAAFTLRIPIMLPADV